MSTPAPTPTNLDSAAKDLAAAAAAVDRPDLGKRVHAVRRRLADTACTIVVVGEYKKGKSTLVNALVRTPICPVDDDIATTRPLIVRYGEEPYAEVVYETDPQRSLPPRSLPPRTAVDQSGEDDEAEAPTPFTRPIPVEQVPLYCTEISPTDVDPVRVVEVRLPSPFLNPSIVVVDTPGVGGPSAALRAATLGALTRANAVLFAADASQELTAPELEFLEAARRLCPTVVMVLTKIDFYPHWRRILALDEGHLARAGVNAQIFPISATLREYTLTANDREMNVESGYADLVSHLRENVAAQVLADARQSVVRELAEVAGQLDAKLAAEEAVLADPEAAQQIVAKLESAKAQVDNLRGRVARWQQVLNEGVTDLNADVEHDLRARFREIVRQGEETIEKEDPAKIKDEFEPWVYNRVATEVASNYAYLHQRSQQLATRVAQFFEIDHGEIVNQLTLSDPSELTKESLVDPIADVKRFGAAAKGFSMFRGTYSGMLMFGMFATLAGLNLALPALLGVGVIMGRKSLKEEKERRLNQNRSLARQAVRKYTDEISFVVSKDCRDNLRQVQRQLRDHFGARAEELSITAGEALAAAQDGAKSDVTTRKERLDVIRAERRKITAMMDNFATAGLVGGPVGARS